MRETDPLTVWPGNEGVDVTGGAIVMTGIWLACAIPTGLAFVAVVALWLARRIIR